MKSEAVQKNIHPDGYEGSFFLIETSIQSDLQFCCSNAEYNLTGFLRPDVSKELDLMDEINYRIKWVPILFFLYSQAEGFDSQTNIIRQTKRLRVIFNKIK